MWAILKIDKKKIKLLQNDFEKKTGEKFIFYSPKIKIAKYLNNKLVSRELDILGNYIFCFSNLFLEKKNIDILKFSKGLKYFLNGFFPFQKEIVRFIERCKSLENKEGFVSTSLSNYKTDVNYEFLSGPFVKKFFQILGYKDNKLKILIGGIETYIKHNKYLFRSV